MEKSRQYFIGQLFAEVHEILREIRTELKEEIEDERETKEIVEKMEFGLLCPIRKLRIKYDIPYSMSRKYLTKETTNEKIDNQQKGEKL